MNLKKYAPNDFSKLPVYQYVMTKLLLPLFCFFGLTSNAQQWPQPGAEWTYCYGQDLWDGMFAGYLKIAYTRDTLIGGATYNVTEPLPYTSDQTYTHITRYSNDTVYRWVDDQEVFFFHFQLNLGEVFTTYRWINGIGDTSCSSVLPLEVIDSTSVIIGGQNLTRWTLRDTLGFDPGNTGWVTYAQTYFYERIGPSTQYFFLDAYEMVGCEWVSDAGDGFLSGYFDNTFSGFSNHCEVAGIEPETVLNLELFPNPATDFLHSTKQFHSYSIFSADGKIVAEENINGNKIPVEALLPGTYFISFLLQDDQLARAVFIKE